MAPCLRVAGVRTLIFLLMTGWLGGAAYAADSLPVNQVLARIRHLQTTASHHFPAGIFPSYREYNHRTVAKDDDNPFFTGLIALTLQNLRPYLSPAEQLVCDSICADAQKAYPLYRNKKGRPTYNFWRTNPTVVFPHSGWINLMNRTHALPDDIDDTNIILLASAAPADTVKMVHGLMQLHTNAGKNRKKMRYKEYEGIEAYSTWFGISFPVDIDVCVLSNVLYAFQKYGIPFSHADSASLRFICAAVDNGHYITRPSYVSPHYARTPTILYHLSRLMEAGHLAELEQRKPALAAEARRQFDAAVNPMDKIMLATVLMRWKQPVPAVTWHTEQRIFSYLENNDFAFFVASMTSILPDPFRQWVGSTGTGRFYYYCPAYNDLLLLEYLVMQRQLQNTVR